MKYNIKLGSFTFKNTDEEVKIENIEVGIEEIKLTEIPALITSVKDAVLEIGKVHIANEEKKAELAHERELARIGFEAEARERHEANRIAHISE